MNNVHLLERQIELEESMLSLGVERFNSNNDRKVKKGEASTTDWNRRLTQELVGPLTDAIIAKKNYYKGRAGKPSRYLKLYSTLPAAQAAFVTIRSIFDFMDKNLTVLKATLAIGSRIEAAAHSYQIERLHPRYINKVKKSLDQRGSSYEHRRKVYSGLGDKLEVPWVSWSTREKAQVGSNLLDLAVSILTFHGEPLFTKQVDKRSRGGNGGFQLSSVLQASDKLTEWVEQYREVVGAMSPAYSPCVVKPRDWTSPTEGGFFLPSVTETAPLVKVDNQAQRKAIEGADMPKVYSAINKLQSVRWKINQDVLKVMKTASILNTGSYPLPASECLIPEGFQLPQSPELEKAMKMINKIKGKKAYQGKTASNTHLLATLDTGMSVARAFSKGTDSGHLKIVEEHVSNSKLVVEFRNWKAEMRRRYEEENKRRESYLTTARVIAEAQKFSKYENLHFVYFTDSRGRVNVRSSLVTPQGGDAQKALLHFADKKELGTSGEFWLGVQGANVWGDDKGTFEERFDIVSSEDFTDMVEDIVVDPLNNRKWTEADKPWQFLAWCYEWAALQVHKHDLGQPASTFKTQLPVAMDGSCSGIQHYSAMLRDAVGGSAVNLLPAAEPQDIYKEVAKVVISKMQKEADSELKPLAKLWLEQGITRDLTKKSVMTLPYGSTTITCRGSVEEFLAKAQKKSGGALPLTEHSIKSQAVSYCTKMIWDSIGDVVIAAREGMAFISAVTKAVSRQNKPLHWVTPLGFPIMQSRWVGKETRIKTQLFGTTTLTIKEDTKKIDARKMSSSAAPNFVHGMDATHLMMTSDDFIDDDKQLAVIHDSFGTHAGDVEELRDVLKDTFIDLYSNNNVLENFLRDSEEQIDEIIDIPVPEMMGLELEAIRHSDFIFG